MYTDHLDIRQERSRAAQDAQGSLDIHTTRLEKVLLATIKHFIRSLLPWTSGAGTNGENGNESGAGAEAGDANTSADEGLKSVLDLLANGQEGYWSVRSRWGWYREFVRLYANHLTQLDGVVERDLLVGLKGGAGDKGEREEEGEEAEEGEEGEGGGENTVQRAGRMVWAVWAAGVRGEE